MAAGSVGEGRWAAVGLAVATGALVSIRLVEPGWFDNEGRFAEGAREMWLRGDYVTPYVNFVPLLTKPPLTQWLAAMVYWVTGPSEWARLVSVLAAMVTLVATCRLGARLFGARVGLVAGVMLATTIGFVLEARTLRPDSLVVASVTVAIFCWHVADSSAERARTRWLVALYAVLGLGTLAKGLVPVVMAGIPIGFETFRRHGLGGLRRLRPVLGLVVAGVIVLPWHVAAALANPGFAWDYVVNQHLLFAFDQKLPRDSEGDSLTVFWGAFVGRGAPWVLFLPIALRQALGGGARDGTPLLWAWLAGVLVTFSITPSRLEHYSLPALPAVALLAAHVWQRARERGLRPLEAGYVATLGVALVAAGVFGLVRGPAVLAARLWWLPQAPGLLALVAPTALVVCGTGVLLIAAAAARSATAVVATLAVGATPLLAIVVRALIEAEALFSWRPVARALARLPPQAEVVFEAPVEYQIIGGLNFYTRRRLTMLEPRDGYVPPTFLEGRTLGLFITRDELERRWHAGRLVAIVSDPHTRRSSPEGVAPSPFFVLDRYGDRWILTNAPVAAAG